MAGTRQTNAVGGLRRSTRSATTPCAEDGMRLVALRRQQALDAEDTAASGTSDHDSLATYLREIARVPRLTPAEEQALGKRVAAGDEEALHRLVEANLRLIVAVARRYHHVGIALHDLVQEGNIGLLRAAQTFDYRTGNRFSTYAVWWIRQAVSRAFANQAYAIRVPLHLHEVMGHAERDATQAADDMPVAGQRQGGEKHVPSAEALNRARQARQTVSLDRMLAEDGAADAVADAVADADAPSPFDVTANRVLRERLIGSLEGLAARERAVVSLRYGLVDGHSWTCAEVGAHLHLTRERTRQIEVLALKKLRYGAAGAELEQYLA
jgi:RNA polymerase primary sigma factor